MGPRRRSQSGTRCLSSGHTSHSSSTSDDDYEQLVVRLDRSHVERVAAGLIDGQHGAAARRKAERWVARMHEVP